jgi:integrase
MSSGLAELALRGLGMGRRRSPARAAAEPGVVASAIDSPLPRALERAVVALPDRPLGPLIAEFTATFGAAWSPVTRRKHGDDFERFGRWLDATGRPATTASLDFLTLVAYVAELRARPKVSGVWRGTHDALARSLAAGSPGTLSANTVNAYLRPIRSLCIWLVDEDVLSRNPFRRTRRRAALNPLLPSEETPTKSATLEDLRDLERGCSGDAPLDLRDRAIVALLVTTAARNSSVRLLRIGDLDFERRVVRFRRAKGGKTLEVALHPAAADAVTSYLARGRPALVAPAAGGLEPPPTAILFPSLAGDRSRPLSMNAVSLLLTRRYHASGGTLPYFGSHRIRHAVATLLANNGMPLEELSRFMGHSSTEVTRRYAVQTPDALGRRAADALERAGVIAAPTGSPPR